MKNILSTIIYLLFDIINKVLLDCGLIGNILRSYNASIRRFQQKESRSFLMMTTKSLYSEKKMLIAIPSDRNIISQNYVDHVSVFRRNIFSDSPTDLMRPFVFQCRREQRRFKNITINKQNSVVIILYFSIIIKK